MRAVGINQLKSNLGHYVRLAEAGETVLVTDHDRVVAQLVPPHPERLESAPDTIVAAAVRDGWLAPAATRTGRPPRSRPVAPTATVLDELTRDRDAR